MNIFYLHNDPKICASYHTNKHVVKMILEYAQLMSTAHRVLDGTVYESKTKNNRRIKRWLLDDDRENILWKASHIQHPSGIWLRSSSENYKWLYRLWLALLDEYNYRYSKIHSAIRMAKPLEQLPNNIPIALFTEPALAMPEKYKVYDNSILSYKNYYNGAKQHLASWKNRPTPEWFKYA